MRALLLVGILCLATVATAQGALDMNPVLNGDFEEQSPVNELFRGGPVDRCVSVGHQAFYVLYPGLDAVGASTGIEILWEPEFDEDDPANSDVPVPETQGELDPQEGVDEDYFLGEIETKSSDPLGTTIWASGYGICDEAYVSAVANVNPVTKAGDPAMHWSDLEGTSYGDFDGDGDREARITGTSHNMWQSYQPALQAWSGNFESLTFTVEDGSIAPGALIQISLVTTPGEAQTPYVGAFLMCALNFRADQLTPDENGVVTLDPVEGQFVSRYVDCDEAEDEWYDEDTTEEDRRDILGRLRIGQLSFWSFSDGHFPVVVDDVSINGGTTFAEEIAEGNIDVDPMDLA